MPKKGHKKGERLRRLQSRECNRQSRSSLSENSPKSATITSQEDPPTFHTEAISRDADQLNTRVSTVPQTSRDTHKLSHTQDNKSTCNTK